MTAATPESLLGKRLLRMSLAHYPCQEPEDQGPLELRFDDGTSLVLELDADGQSINHNFRPLEFVAPTLNQVVWSRVTVDSPISLGARLTRIDELQEHTPEGYYVAAWRIWFGHDFVCYANNGDHSVVSVNKNPASFEHGWVTLYDSDA